MFYKCNRSVLEFSGEKAMGNPPKETRLMCFLLEQRLMQFLEFR